VDGRDIGERSDAVLRTAMPGHDGIEATTVLLLPLHNLLLLLIKPIEPSVTTSGGHAGRCRAAADLTPQPRPSNLPLIRLGAAGDFSSRRTS
jgi:hypothetical protein